MNKDFGAKNVKTQEKQPVVYWQTLSYAAEHGEREEYIASRKLNQSCKKAIEEAISNGYDGRYLDGDVVKPLLKRFGSERITFVLANTLQLKSWDGRFSGTNKKWASEINIPENPGQMTDVNCELIISSHPAVIDGFVNLFRKETGEI